MRLFRKDTGEQVAGGDVVYATLGNRRWQISDWNPPHPRDGVTGRVYCWPVHDPSRNIKVSVRGFNAEEIGLEWRP